MKVNNKIILDEEDDIINLNISQNTINNNNNNNIKIEVDKTNNINVNDKETISINKENNSKTIYINNILKENFNNIMKFKLDNIYQNLDSDKLNIIKNIESNIELMNKFKAKNEYYFDNYIKKTYIHNDINNNILINPFKLINDIKLKDEYLNNISKKSNIKNCSLNTNEIENNFNIDVDNLDEDAYSEIDDNNNKYIILPKFNKFIDINESYRLIKINIINTYKNFIIKIDDKYYNNLQIGEILKVNQFQNYGLYNLSDNFILIKISYLD